jgi:penicillin V acylase-like amidase (Ntn superfamily)
MIRKAALITCAIAAVAVPSIYAQACTRAVYLGADGLVITGRNMDWVEDMRSNLWVFPRGMARDGAAGPGSAKWTSKYGSLITAAYDFATTDGINERGLVANVLYLAASDYGSASTKPPLSISVWAQYALDNYATVAEAVEGLRAEPFKILAPTLPNGFPALLHLSLSDATGDSAIFEFVNGKLNIHHGRDYQVMTNEPAFDQQLALNAYWQTIGGETFLPGTVKPEDRFVRASYLIKALPTKVDPSIINAIPHGGYANQATAGVVGVMRAVSVPIVIKSPGASYAAATLWRTIADQKNLVYFFDSATSPNTFWVSLSQLDMSEGAPVKKLTLEGGRIYSGEASGSFETAKPFAFLAPNGGTIGARASEEHGKQ